MTFENWVITVMVSGKHCVASMKTDTLIDEKQLKLVAI